MRLIANKVSDLAVTNHTAHVRSDDILCIFALIYYYIIILFVIYYLKQTQEIDTIFYVLIDYVEPECKIMGNLYEESARQRSKEVIAQEIVGLDELKELDDDDNKTIWL
jgi:hypothetical protein